MFGSRKLAPKGVKLCPGCPPKEVKPLTFPKFRFTQPEKKTDTRVINVVNLKSKKDNQQSNSLF